MKPRAAAMRAAASDPFLLATDLADYLVRKGVPFRTAHEVIGKLTAFSLKEQRGFADLTLAEYQKFSSVFTPDVFAVLNLETALAARHSIGAPSPANVAAEISAWKFRLASAQ
jgi:argininosuccinate lyase